MILNLDYIYLFVDRFSDVPSNTTDDQNFVVPSTIPRNEITTTEKILGHNEYPRYTPPPRQVPEARTPPTPPSTPYFPSPPTYIPRPRVQPEIVHVQPNTPRKTVEIRPNQDGKSTFDVKKLPENTLVTFVAPAKHCIPGYEMNQRGECVGGLFF